MVSPDQILDLAFQQASAHIDQPFIGDNDIVEPVEYICRNLQNRAGVRLLLACLLAKVHKPQVDIRKPYTEIGDTDVYSGRTYDEAYVTAFINQHNLPANPTTAFLTPALRNRNVMLTTDLNLVGRPPRLYQTLLQLLDDVQTQKVSADVLLAETIRWLLVIRDEQQQRRATLLAALKSADNGVPLSAEMIVKLIDQHLNQPRSSRLPVLVVSAAYEAASVFLGERGLTLSAHNAADQQTRSLGDLEITLIEDDQIITAYEMKTRPITREDVNRALQKISTIGQSLDNYIFITTEFIDPPVQEYAKSIYETTNGIEIVILDCIGFLRHYLHLFHRIRMQFLEAYQDLVLAEPESAVSQPLKEVFLTLRQAAESWE